MFIASLAISFTLESAWAVWRTLPMHHTVSEPQYLGINHTIICTIQSSPPVSVKPSGQCGGRVPYYLPSIWCKQFFPFFLMASIFFVASLQQPFYQRVLVLLQGLPATNLSRCGATVVQLGAGAKTLIIAPPRGIYSNVLGAYRLTSY